MRIYRLSYVMFIIVLFISCHKTDDKYTPGPDTSVSGTILFQGTDSIVGLDLQTQSIKFSSPVYDAQGSQFTFIGYDSGYLYKSTGKSYMAAYNTTDGKGLWKFLYYCCSSAGSMMHTQKMMFVDSTMFFVQYFLGIGTSVYCLNKKTGQLIWKKQIINSDVIFTSNYVPVVLNDRVLVAGKNNSTGVEILYCFNRLTGQQLWQYTIDESVTNKLEVYNNGFISYGKKITSLSADGILRWQITTPATAVANSIDYFSETGKMLTFKSYTGSMECYWINKDNGSITQGPIFPGEYSQCIYKENKVYFLYPQVNTTITVKAYNMQTGAELWNCPLPKPYGSLDNTYFTKMLITDERIIFGEKQNISASKRSKFNLIDPVTGGLQEVFTRFALPTKYFACVKGNNVYTPPN